MQREARRLLELTADCRDSMHEPDEQGFKRVRLVGDHLDNAFGTTITEDAIMKCYQEYVLIIEQGGEPNGSGAKHEPFNLATLIALARIGAQKIVEAHS